MNFSPARIQLRDANKIASTNMINDLANALNAQQPQYVVGTVGPSPQIYFRFIGRIFASGPNNEADYTDERYWVRVQWIPSAQTDDNVSLNDDEYDRQDDGSDGYEGPAHPNVYTVTNLSERNVTNTPGSGSHNLPVGTAVLVFVDGDVGNPGTGDDDEVPAQEHYVMCVGGSLPKAQYQGEIFQAGADGALSMTFIRGNMLNPSGTNGI